LARAISKILFILGSYNFLAYLECIRSYAWSKGHSDPDLSSVVTEFCHYVAFQISNVLLDSNHISLCFSGKTLNIFLSEVVYIYYHHNDREPKFNVYACVYEGLVLIRLCNNLNQHEELFLTIMCVVSMCNKIHEQALVNLSQLQCVYRYYEIKNLAPIIDGILLILR
jgi:hypothetical protein